LVVMLGIIRLIQKVKIKTNLNKNSIKTILEPMNTTIFVKK